MGNKWKYIKTTPPPLNTVVETRINDMKGIRNEQTLKFNGRMWFVPDGSMYIYYEPTEWREIENKPTAAGINTNRKLK